MMDDIPAKATEAGMMDDVPSGPVASAYTIFVEVSDVRRTATDLTEV